MPGCCDRDLHCHFLWSCPGQAAPDDGRDGPRSQQSACVAFGLRSRSAVAFATPLQPGQLLLLDYGDQRMMHTVPLTPF